MYDLVIIGGGIVGIWSAIVAAQEGYKVAIIEQKSQLGTFASSRNSGVLHAGIYYDKSSNKAFHCLRGNRLTRDFIKTHKVIHNPCGKYIIPMQVMDLNLQDNIVEMEKQLLALFENALNNKVENIKIINTNMAKHNFLNCRIALESKDTFVIDLPSYIETLIKILEKLNIKILLNTKFITGISGEVEVLQNTLDSQHLPQKIKSKFILNSAGLYSDEVANQFGLKQYSIKPNKGCFFKLKNPLPINKLIYPLPFPGSSHLGTHYTVDAFGEGYIGPDATWAKNKEDYEINPNLEKFYASLNKQVSYYERSDLLHCSKVGIRARLYKDGNPHYDFVIEEYPKNVFHFLGIESPGLTSAPSLAIELIEKLKATVSAG